MRSALLLAALRPLWSEVQGSDGRPTRLHASTRLRFLSAATPAGDETGPQPS